MKVVIIEDEAPAARRLVGLIQEIDPSMQVVSVIESVEEGIEYLSKNPAPDVIFSDIQLADGISFIIFEKILPLCPIVFITAFDQYAIKAFEVNSIDYLLKPISKEQLERSIGKLKRFNSTEAKPQMQNLIADLVPKKPKQRFLISKGDSLIPVHAVDIAYIYTEDKAVMIKTLTGSSYFISYSLDELEQQLDEEVFFRLNRQVIANLAAINKISNYFNGKLKIDLKPAYSGEVIVSRSKAPLFKSWLER